MRTHDLRYRSNRIKDLANLAGIHSITDTLPDGIYTGVFRYKNYPLNVFVSDGEVTHIGIQLFSPEFRKHLSPPQIYNFVERYLLEYYLLPKIELANGKNYKVDEFRVDQVKIEAGRFKDFYKILGDSTLNLSVVFKDQRRYTLEWSRDFHPVYAISFPASNNLIEGFDYDEALDRLCREITLPDTIRQVPTSFEFAELEPCDSLRGDFFILRGGMCLIPAINSDKYLVATADSTVSLLYDPRYPVESLANLLTTAEIDNSYIAKIGLTYPHNQPDDFLVPLNALIQYFMKEGCRPYFGLKRYSRETDVVSALLLLKNDSNGYLHMFNVTFDTSTLTNRQGDIKMRLTPFIPLHDIKNMFKTDN